MLVTTVSISVIQDLILVQIKDVTVFRVWKTVEVFTCTSTIGEDFSERVSFLTSNELWFQADSSFASSPCLAPFV